MAERLEEGPSQWSGQVAGPFSASQRLEVGRLWESEYQSDFEYPEPSKKAVLIAAKHSIKQSRQNGNQDSSPKQRPQVSGPDGGLDS